MTDTNRAALALSDAGRSWTEISERTGLDVPTAKAAVREAKSARRKALAHTQRNETARGLLDRCRGARSLRWGRPGCGHLRPQHGEDGCTRENCYCEYFYESDEPHPWANGIFGPGLVSDVHHGLLRAGEDASLTGPEARAARRSRAGVVPTARPARRLARLRRRGRDQTAQDAR